LPDNLRRSVWRPRTWTRGTHTRSVRGRRPFCSLVCLSALPAGLPVRVPVRLSASQSPAATRTRSQTQTRSQAGARSQARTLYRAHRFVRIQAPKVPSAP